MAGTNPNLNNINLTAPGAPPSALMAEQAQIQLRQEIAQALMAQSMADQSPVIHTGGSNNPFARDVANIGGPIGEVAEAIMGRNLANKVGSQQIDLAQRAEGIRESGINQMMQDIQGYDQGVPGPDGSTPVHVAGNVLKAAQDAMSSPHPAVQALGKSLLETYAANQAKSIATPGDIGTLAKTQIPGSIGNSLTPLLFGGSGIDPSKLQMKPVVSPLAAGSSVVSTDPNLIPAAPTSPASTGGVQPAGIQPSGATTTPLAGPGQMPVTPANYIQDTTADGIPYMRAPRPGETGGDGSVTPGGAPAGPGASANPSSPSKVLLDPQPDEVLYPGDTSKITGFTNKLDVPVSRAASSAKYEVMTGIQNSPHVATLEKEGKDAVDYLSKGQAEHVDAKNQITRIADVMDIANRSRGQYGITGDLRMKMLRIETDLGLSKDEQGRIPATQSGLARLLGTVANNTRAITPRPAQLLVQAEQEASGAHVDVDKRHIVDIGGAMIADIMNSRDNWNNTEVPTRGKTALGEEGANKYKVEYPDPIFPQGMPVNIIKDANGSWHNESMLIGRPINNTVQNAPSPPAIPGQPPVSPYAGKSTDEIMKMLGGK